MNLFHEMGVYAVYFLTAVLVLIEPSTGSAQNAALPLKSPVNIGARQTPAPATIARSCPVPAPLPRVLTSLDAYTDPANSIVDPTKLADELKAQMPIRRNEVALAQATTSFASSSVNSGFFADCIIWHLQRFALDDAFNGTTQFRGTGTVRLLSTTPLFAYMVLKSSNYEISSDVDALVRSWIIRLSENLLRYERENVYGNNISYWAGASLAAAAVALNDRRLLEAAIGIARSAIKKVSTQGLLPEEMARGTKALEYNLFATQALALIAAVAHSNGIDLYLEDDGALLRLMNTMAKVLLDPEYFIEIGGSPAAISTEHIYKQNFGWLVTYREYTGNRAVDALICSSRPLFLFRAGGDWFSLFGQTIVCSP